MIFHLHSFHFIIISSINNKTIYYEEKKVAAIVIATGLMNLASVNSNANQVNDELFSVR